MVGALFGLPAFEVLMLYVSLGVALVHDTHFRHKRVWTLLVDYAHITAIGVFVPAALALNGLYSWTQVVVSALIGLAIGVVATLHLVSATWQCYFQVLANTPLLRLVGFTHQVDTLYQCALWAI